MFDPVTLDQLRAFVTVVEEGSFSAAARKLRRVQSAISTAMANLEAQLGVTLWDRSTRIARLTEQGEAVLASARRVLLEVDALKRAASGMALGVEPSISLCVDALFPLAALVDVCARFAKEMPAVDLRVDTQVLSAVTARVLSGDATLGVVAAPGLVPGVARTPLAAILMVPVVAGKHPLAALRGRIPLVRLAGVPQIVLSERNEAGLPDQGVLSPRTWRVADLHTKHAMLRAGLGWGNLPDHLIGDDLRTGALAAIAPDAWSPEETKLTLFAIHRDDLTPGPAHRWLVEALGAVCKGGTEGPAPARRSRDRRPARGRARRPSP